MDIKSEVRNYVIESLRTYGCNISLEDTSPLITGGLIDSIGMISLVRFLENRYAIRFAPREIGANELDTVDRIESLVSKKLAEAPRTV
jgi:acyl carrier protein